MKLLGRIQHVSRDGNIVVRSGFAPGTNEIVTDGRGRKIGKIVRIFGPTRFPYIAIKPESGLRALAMVGQELYVPAEGDNGQNERRDGRDRKMSRVQQLASGKRSRPR